MAKLLKKCQCFSYFQLSVLNHARICISESTWFDSLIGWHGIAQFYNVTWSGDPRDACKQECTWFIKRSYPGDGWVIFCQLVSVWGCARTLIRDTPTRQDDFGCVKSEQNGDHWWHWAGWVTVDVLFYRNHQLFSTEIDEEMFIYLVIID